MDILYLTSLTCLRTLSTRQVAEIAPYASEIVVPAGQRLLLDGPFAQELVLLACGRARVRCAGELVGDLGPGDVFGARAARRTVYPNATVIATSELRLVMFGTRDLRRLEEHAPAIAAALLAVGAPMPQRTAPARRLTLVPAVAA